MFYFYIFDFFKRLGTFLLTLATTLIIYDLAYVSGYRLLCYYMKQPGTLWSSAITLFKYNLAYLSEHRLRRLHRLHFDFTKPCKVFVTSSIMSASTCCVPNGNKTRKDNISLHVFPRPDLKPERFRSWIYAIGGDILALDNQCIFKNRRVCHIHFEERFYTRSKLLSPNAIPTLHLPGHTRRRTAV